MDCDTTGIEPDFALVKFKKLAGGGYFKIVNQSVPEALTRLGYARAEVQEIVAYVSGTNTLLAAPHVNRATLKAARPHRRRPRQGRGRAPRRLRARARVRAVGPRRGGVRAPRRHRTSSAAQPGFSLLKHLGFTRAEIDEANDDDHRPHDDRRRAAPARRALRGVRLREPLRQDRPALPRADVAT